MPLIYRTISNLSNHYRIIDTITQRWINWLLTVYWLFSRYIVWSDLFVNFYYHNDKINHRSLICIQSVNEPIKMISIYKSKTFILKINSRDSLHFFFSKPFEMTRSSTEYFLLCETIYSVFSRTFKAKMKHSSRFVQNSRHCSYSIQYGNSCRFKCMLSISTCFFVSNEHHTS